MHALNMSLFLPPPFLLVFLFMCALASSGGGEVASEHEGAASHMALEGHATDSEFTSETEGEGSSTAGTRGDTSDTDTSSEGSSLVVAATSVPTATTGTAATQRTSSALPAAPQRSPRARSPRKVGISFAPGTSGPAPVTPAVLSEEVIDLLRMLIVGQSTLLNAIQGVEREVHRSNAYLEGIHSAGDRVAAQATRNGHGKPTARNLQPCGSELRGRIVRLTLRPALRDQHPEHLYGGRADKEETGLSLMPQEAAVAEVTTPTEKEHRTSPGSDTEGRYSGA
ncbi:hypothetical protein NDU88_002536 [Pleurodeles waltl]|uniref:Uncharacterized protein n=1 Tax=Pleurodeles waltl TaxID=8319 RepID=A0AAV7V009_PLEWA|nr:hypothetical protein NDU88_002536 [Pleurodeles waltl]